MATEPAKEERGTWVAFRSGDFSVVLDENDNAIGTVTDDLVVASAPEGSLVDETIDVRDADGNLIVEDETVTVYDADSHVVAKSETITLPLDSE